MQLEADTPREEYTIAGKTFQIPQPFVEGDTINEGEADALNQTFAENVRNNFAKRVKDADEAGSFDQDTFQSQLDEYMAGYEFGVRQGGGGRTVDPVAREMRTIADAKVRARLKELGKKTAGKNADITAKEVNDLTKAYVTKHEGTLRPLAEAAVARLAELPDAA